MNISFFNPIFMNSAELLSLKSQNFSIISIGVLLSIFIHGLILLINPIQPIQKNQQKIITTQLLKESKKEIIEEKITPKVTESKEKYQEHHKIIHKNKDKIIYKNQQSQQSLPIDIPKEKTEIVKEEIKEKEIEKNQNNDSPTVSKEIKEIHKNIETPTVSKEIKESPKKSEISKASYLLHPKPIYPSASKENNEEGKVVLKVLVDEDGNPNDIQIKKSSGFDRLDNSAIQAVQKWKFNPAKKDGNSIESWVIVPIPFHLEHED